MSNPYDTETTLVNEEWSTDPPSGESEDRSSREDEGDDQSDAHSDDNRGDSESGSEDESESESEEESESEYDSESEARSDSSGESGPYENERVIFSYKFGARRDDDDIENEGGDESN